MNTPEQRVKIALQKSGRLADHSLDLLARCGLKFTQSKDQLFCYGENMPVDLLLVRDDDIPGLVSDDACDLGIAGLNVIAEKRLEMQKNDQPALFDQICGLDFGHCRLAIAAPENKDYCGPQSLQNARIATSYVATRAPLNVATFSKTYVRPPSCRHWSIAGRSLAFCSKISPIAVFTT